MDIIVKKPSGKEQELAETWPVWEKKPSTFPYFYDKKETCLIIEGEAAVATSNGKMVDFKSGDLVIFPKGLKCTWTIKKGIRKHYNFS